VANNSEPAQHYRAIANELLRQAEGSQNLELKIELRQIAGYYLRLADGVERHSYSLPEIDGARGGFLGMASSQGLRSRF
jgi:hypothetical protein